MWNATEDQELLRLWPSNSASKIAGKLGKTRNAVIGRMHRINQTYAGRVYGAEIGRREQTSAKRKAKAKLVAAAITEMNGDIEAGVPRNKAIKIAYKAGATLEAIAGVFGITRQAISLIVRGQS